MEAMQKEIKKIIKAYSEKLWPLASFGMELENIKNAVCEICDKFGVIPKSKFGIEAEFWVIHQWGLENRYYLNFEIGYASYDFLEKKYKYEIEVATFEYVVFEEEIDSGQYRYGNNKRFWVYSKKQAAEKKFKQLKENQ